MVGNLHAFKFNVKAKEERVKHERVITDIRRGFLA